MLEQVRVDVEVSRPPLVVVEVPAISLSEEYPGEVGRWAVLIGVPMLFASVCVALAIGTSLSWLYGGAVLFGPGMGVAAIIYLALSTDTNGRSGPAIEDSSRSASLVAVTAGSATS